MNEIILKERTKRLFEINKVIKQLDSTIRPAAFLLLQDYALIPATSKTEKQSPASKQHNGEEERTDFFSKFNHSKPSDNAFLLSAHYYSQYGASPFSLEEIETLANEVGVTIPERLDKTFLTDKRGGKSLFLRAGKGAFRPTVHGEAFFKNSYKVSKGTRQKPAVAE